MFAGFCLEAGPGSGWRSGLGGLAGVCAFRSGVPGGFSRGGLIADRVLFSDGSGGLGGTGKGVGAIPRALAATAATTVTPLTAAAGACIGLLLLDDVVDAALFNQLGHGA